MRSVTNNFKTGLIQNSREFDCQIIYTISGTTTTLGKENVYNVNYSYKGSILKSIMKQLEFESDRNIPLETNLEYRIGLFVENAYEYISYGTFIVKEVEYKEDTETYLITCYDKMLYTMTDYVNLGITYPITIRSYINAICTHLGLTFKNANSTFTNYNRQIPNELYLASNGDTLYYSFRDVLDELAQVTASCICINEDDGQLEVRYPTTRTGIDNNYLKDTNVKKNYKEYGPINCVELCRSADSDMIYQYDELSEREHGLTTIRISNNQILNGEDRENYLHEIFNRLDGLTYTICDLSSYGILFYDLLDNFPISWTDDNNETHTINVLMLNDNITQGQMVEERIEDEEPLTAFVDYGEKSKEVKNDNRATILVDKANASISQIVQSVGQNGEVTAGSILLAINNDTSQATINADKISLEGYTTINNNFEIDTNGNAILNGGDINLHDNGDPFDLNQSSIFITGTSSTFGEFSNYASSTWNYWQRINNDGATFNTSVTSHGLTNSYSDTTGSEPINKIISIGMGEFTDQYANPSIHIEDNDNFTNISPSGIGVNGPQASIEINSNPVYSVVTLYNNTSGSSSEITLSDSVLNYEYIEIFYGWTNGTYGYTSTKIYSPQGKTANLTSHALNNSQLYIASSQWTISGNKITPSISEYWTLRTNGYPTRGTTANIEIFRVVGYK